MYTTTGRCEFGHSTIDLVCSDGSVIQGVCVDCESNVLMGIARNRVLEEYSIGFSVNQWVVFKNERHIIVSCPSREAAQAALRLMRA